MLRRGKIKAVKLKIANGEYDAGWIDDLVARRAVNAALRTPPGPDETMRGEYGCTEVSIWPAIILGVAILGVVGVVLFGLL